MRCRLLLAASAIALLAFTGCAVVDPSGPDAAASPSTSVTESTVPVPGSTLDAAAVTADPPEAVVLAVVVSADPGEQEQVVLDAVQAYAAQHAGSVTVHADASTQDAVSAALATAPDVVVGIGPAVVGPIDLASAAHLDSSFLVLGTQLAEPTDNVVAVVWPGAEERAVFAEETLVFSGAEAYAAEAVRTGLAAFPSGLAGHVVALD